MARWTNEERWDNAIQTAAGMHGIPADLIRAVIGQESAFRPNATREEVALRDQSIGLMQILLGTARGEGYVGIAGDPRLLTGLFDPLTNITYGTSYLARQYSRAGGNMAAAASAYNGGWQPKIGFGVPAMRPLTICLQKDTTGKCVRTRNVPVGEYANQPYVNAVLANFNYFRGKASSSPVTVNVGGATPPLSDANQPQPETDWRTSRAASRTVGTQVWQAIVHFVQWALSCFKNR